MSGAVGEGVAGQRVAGRHTALLGGVCRLAVAQGGGVGRVVAVVLAEAQEASLQGGRLACNDMEVRLRSDW